jgi:DNA polymerase-3 subunit epsilon
MPEGAFAVHGLSSAFLSDKPVFKAIADAFLEFVGDAKLVIHNASFDMKFLNAELKWIGNQPLPYSQAIDTLEIARRKFPGAQNSLDALCRRFGVDNSSREKHGALLDSEILAEVYLELIGGRQPDFALNVVGGTDLDRGNADATGAALPERPAALPPRLTDAEREAHEEFVRSLVKDALWLKAK